MSNLKLVTCIFLAGSFLAGCLPAVFFEEEARTVVDEVFDEEERLHRYPALAAYPPSCFPERRLGRYTSSSNSLESKRRSVRIDAGRPRR